MYPLPPWCGRALWMTPYKISQCENSLKQLTIDEKCTDDELQSRVRISTHKCVPPLQHNVVSRILNLGYMEIG